MKNKLIYAIIVVSLFSFLSCSKDEVNNPTSTNPFSALLEFREGGEEFDPANVNVTMIANGATFSDSVQTIEMIAEFTNTSGVPANTDSVKIGGLKIPQVLRTGFYQKVFGFNSRGDLGPAMALYGGNVSYDVYGTYPMHDYDDSYYLPEIVHFTLYDHGGEIDMTEDLTVTWNADLSNDYVNIGVFYVPRPGDTEYPVHKVYNTADDGSFTIPDEDLAEFPLGYNVNVGIARGFIEDYVLSDSYKARFTGITYSLSEPIIMVSN